MLQAIAVTIKNFLLLDLGIVTAFPVILIPALTGLSSETNPNETIRITAVEASWLGIRHKMYLRFKRNYSFGFNFGRQHFRDTDDIRESILRNHNRAHGSKESNDFC